MATRKRKHSNLSDGSDNTDATPSKKQKLERKESTSVSSDKPHHLLRTTSASTFENAYLPPEILVSIFTKLHRADLARSSRVCQHWYNCSKDPLLGWINCEEFTLSEDGYTIGYFGQNCK